METTKHYLILQQLKEDFINNYNDGNRDSLQSVYMGNRIWEEVEPKPAIAINGHQTYPLRRTLDNKVLKKMDVDVDVFIDYNDAADNDWQDIYKYQDEITNFLYSTGSTYKDDIEIEGEQKVFFGGGNSNIAMARVSFTVSFTETY